MIFELDNSMAVTIVYLVVGALLLLVGRRVFWLVVAGIGFVAGMQLAAALVGPESRWILWIAGLGGGAMGAILAMVLQRVAAGLAGFFGGSLVAVQIMARFGLGSGEYAWLAVFAVAAVGAVLALFLFDWALVLIASLVGATLLTMAFDLGDTLATVVFFALWVLGFAVQANQLNRRREQRGRDRVAGADPGSMT